MLLAGLLITCAIVYLGRTQTTVEGYDRMGYVYAGQRMAKGHGPTFYDPNNEKAGPYFSLYAFQIRRGDDPRFYLGPPPGFPLLLALAQLITGSSQLALYVPSLTALVSLLAVYLLGGVLFSEWVGLGAATWLAFTPTFLTFGTAQWVGVPGLMFMLLGMVSYLKATEAKRTIWQVGLGLLSGALLGYSLFIRYTNVVVILPLMIYILYQQRSLSLRNPANYAFFSVLGITGCVILLFNQWYYGGFLTTCYSPVHGGHPWPLLSVRYVLGSSPAGGHSLVEGARTLWRNFSTVAPLALLGLLTTPRRKAVLIVAVAGAFLIFFSFHAFAPTGINARYLLPVLPMVCLFTALGLGKVSKFLFTSRVRRVVFCGGVILITIVPGLPGHLNGLAERNRSSVGIARYVQGFARDTPPDAVFMSYSYNDWIIYYGQRSTLNYRRIPPGDPKEDRYRFELLEPRLVETVDRLLEDGTPVFYVKDRDPSFWGTLEILQAHFVVERYREEPEIYQILPRANRGGKAVK